MAHPGAELNDTPATRAALNEHQQRRLRVTCQYIDNLLAEAEAALDSAGSNRPFPKYVADLPDGQRQALEDYFSRIRTMLTQVLREQNITPEPPDIPVSRVVRTALLFSNVSIEELRPRHMRGYGEVPPPAADQLLAIARELEDIVTEAETYLAAVTSTEAEPGAPAEKDDAGSGGR